MKRRGASLEYILMVAVAFLMLILVVSLVMNFSFWVPNWGSNNQSATPWLDPYNNTHFNMSDEYFIYRFHVEPVGGGLYKVVYRFTANKTLTNVTIKTTLECKKQPEYIEPEYLHVEEFYERIPKGWYVSNYWTPIKSDEFPCRVVFNVQVGSS